jgi:acetyl-CoA C-acetyltransferase
MTVNRVCGSGAQAIVSAAQEILMGSVDTAIAGGMENMDAAPYLIPRGRWGHRMGDGTLYDSVLRDGLNDAFSDAHSGWHTEDLVTKFQISRTAQDEWALRSHQRFSVAQAAGKFAREIAPVEIAGRKGPGTFKVDAHNRPDASIEALSKLKPVFRDGGTITAGNAPGLNTAAAAMVLASEAYAGNRGLTPVARLVSYGISAVEPGMFGLGPIPAVKQALARAGWIPPDIVNVEGGAIAHGHPIGATGAVLTTRLLHSMRRDGLKRGVATMCIGGGQGIALALEMIN